MSLLFRPNLPPPRPASVPNALVVVVVHLVVAALLLSEVVTAVRRLRPTAGSR